MFQVNIDKETLKKTVESGSNELIKKVVAMVNEKYSIPGNLLALHRIENLQENGCLVCGLYGDVNVTTL